MMGEMIPCIDCGGRGWHMRSGEGFQRYEDCDTCDGDGIVPVPNVGGLADSIRKVQEADRVFAIHNAPANPAAFEDDSEDVKAVYLDLLLDWVEGVLEKTDPENEDSYFNDHARECCETIAFDERRGNVLKAIEYLRGKST